MGSEMSTSVLNCRLALASLHLEHRKVRKLRSIVFTFSFTLSLSLSFCVCVCVSVGFVSN